MIAVQNLELRAGARLLMEEVTFRIDKGDKIGLLSARGLDGVARKMRQAQEDMASEDEAVRAKGLRRYDRLEAEFIAGGGYAAESEAAVITSNLDLPERVLSQPLSTLSGGQRRRVELARILFSNADTMLLDEPTNHLDADSIMWLRDFLKNFSGGLLVISHDVDLMELVVNRVFYLDANRCVQHGLEELPGPARAGRTPPQARARQRPEEGERPHGAGE